jgi:hypothetical protein
VLPTQLFGVLAVMGESVVVIVPPWRYTPPAPRSSAWLSVTAVWVRVVAVDWIAEMPPPRPAVLPVMNSGLPETPVTVSVPRRPL